MLGFRNSSGDPTLNQHASVQNLVYLALSLASVSSFETERSKTTAQQSMKWDIFAKLQGQCLVSKGTQYSWFTSSRYRNEKDFITSLQGWKWVWRWKTTFFLINPFTSQTAVVEVILILHVCGNHCKVKALTPHSPWKMLESGAEVLSVSHPGGTAFLFPSCGSRAISRQHSTKALTHTWKIHQAPKMGQRKLFQIHFPFCLS